MSKAMLICTDCRQSQKSCMWKEQCVQLAYFKKRPTDSLAISAPAGEFLYKYHLREGIWHSARMPEALSIMSQFPQCPNCLSKDKQEECKKKKIRLSSLTIILLSTSISLNDRQEVSGIPWPVRVHSKNIHSQNVVIKIYNKPCIKPCCVFPWGTQLFMLETQKINLPYWNRGKEHVCFRPGQLIGAYTDSVWNTQKEEFCNDTQ